MRTVLILLVALAQLAAAQSVRVLVISGADSAPVHNAIVRSMSASVRTGADGIANISAPAPGGHIVAARIGFEPDSVAWTGAAIGPSVTIILAPSAEIEGMVISATRSGRLAADDPVRVETLDREEVEEKLRMTPGDITMMLNETPGLRVQITSPALGAANVRVQGLRGRYTQILSDGLPLFGGQTGGLGLLQIPPMDLGGVEIVKGVASALYGGNALGGVINLVSRVPGEDPVAELLVNQTMLSGSDVVGFGARMFDESWGGSALVGFHRQGARDVDEDGWIDVPKYDRLVVRPRLYWNSASGHTAMITAGTTIEERAGGSPAGVPGTALLQRYDESLGTRRFDAGAVSRWLFGSRTLSLRGSTSLQRHSHDFGPVGENDRHFSSFAEASVTQSMESGSLVVGTAVQQDWYVNRSVQGFDFDFVTPGVFAQGTIDVGSRLSLTASGRLDDHSEYGTRASPRLSALVRAPADVTVRASFGSGFFAPTPLTEETEATGLSPVEPLVGIVAEKATTASLDFSRAFGVAEVGAALFGSRIIDPIIVTDAGNGRLRVSNSPHSTDAAGVELRSRFELDPMHLNLSYTFIDAREGGASDGGRRELALTPRHQAGMVAAWESEDARAGLELYHTGRQQLEDNPYRTRSAPYTHLGLLVERRFGSARVWINAENLLGFRQTDTHPLVRPTRGSGGRWTTDVWGPLEGRTANIGVRWQ